MNPKLYTIIYEVTDEGRPTGDIKAFNTVGVDMDEGTATLLAINNYKSGFAIEGTDDEELSDDFFREELGDIHWLEIPDEIDNFEITVKEKS